LWRAHTMLVTPGICLMSDSLILSLPSPYQRKPICIGIVFSPFCWIDAQQPCAGRRAASCCFHSSISIVFWQVVNPPFFWRAFCELFPNTKNREKNFTFLTVYFTILL